MDRQTEEDDDDFVTVEASQTVDIKLDDHPDGVAVRFRTGLIFTSKHAAVISRAWRDSKNPNIVRPRNEDEQNPPDDSLS